MYDDSDLESDERGGAVRQDVNLDAATGDSLGETVVTAVADAAGVDPDDVEGRLYDVVEPDALDDLLRPRADGTPRAGAQVTFPFHGHHVTVTPDAVTVESALERVKCQGGNLLVVGDVPDAVVDDASAFLLGDSDADRAPLFALHGRGASTALDRVVATGGDAHQTEILVSGAPTRSTAATLSTDDGPTYAPVSGDVDAFRDAIVAAIDEADRRADGFQPAQLRFCLDSLAPIADEHGLDALRRFVAPICGAVVGVGGIGHYVLPEPRDADAVAAVEDSFDVVVELRADIDGTEQRWHLPDAAYTTPWFTTD
jgi:hypothetical protein